MGPFFGKWSLVVAILDVDDAVLCDGPKVKTGDWSLESCWNWCFGLAP